MAGNRTAPRDPEMACDRVRDVRLTTCERIRASRTACEAQSSPARHPPLARRARPASVCANGPAVARRPHEICLPRSPIGRSPAVPPGAARPTGGRRRTGGRSRALPLGAQPNTPARSFRGPCPTSRATASLGAGPSRSRSCRCATLPPRLSAHPVARKPTSRVSSGAGRIPSRASRDATTRRCRPSPVGRRRRPPEAAPGAARPRADARPGSATALVSASGQAAFSRAPPRSLEPWEIWSRTPSLPVICAPRSSSISP